MWNSLYEIELCSLVFLFCWLETVCRQLHLQAAVHYQISVWIKTEGHLQHSHLAQEN